MRKIKDFFYDKNDILIVLIIVAAAAFIIYTRIDVIMEYPEKAAQAAIASESPLVEQESSTPAETTGDDKEEDKDKKTEDDESIGSNTTISITIDDSDTSISVSERLAEAGLVSSAEKFESYITNNDKAGSIQSGTFEIPSGASDEEILNIIAP